MKRERNVYLKMKSLAEAQKILQKRFSMNQNASETVSVPEGVGRVLAEPVFARISSPNFHAAAMDGIAVRAEDTFGASEGTPKALMIGTDAFYLNTGHVMPANTDAVIMIEHVIPLEKESQDLPERVGIEAPAFPWQHVRRMGEDIVATELLFPRNHRITPYCVGALLSGGIFSVPVRKKPNVVIFPTGSELVDWRNLTLSDLRPGQVIESNAYVLAAMVGQCGGLADRREKMVDDPEMIEAAVKEAAYGDDADIILIIGGSSAGSEDYSRWVIDRLGEVLIHGVTIMPGKPAVIGVVNEKPVFGIPGYPVSAIVVFEQFVGPLIYKALGQPEPTRQRVMVSPTRKLPSKLGVEEFLRVKLGRVGGRIVATSLPRGAGTITSITEAHGILRIPAHLEGIKEGAEMEAELLRPVEEIENTIVAVGSHDNTLDLLADELKAGGRGISLSSSHVGSMGGLMAIKRGVCHLAGAHLLDTEDGSYNVSYISKFLPNIPVKRVNLVFRDQGLIVARGNPKSIRGIEDLARNEIRFINRQGGSGTRILLDYRLNELGINPDAIPGYENEEFTHMAVAVAVLSRTADAGLGIQAAAKALNLDFIPVVTEQYDLIIPDLYFETEPIQILLETIRADRFKARVAALGGYHTHKTGMLDPEP